MGLEDQAAVKRVAEEHRDVVVLLGTPDAESTQTLAQTVVAGDPSYAGPLAGVPLGLPVFHVFEPELKRQVAGGDDGGPDREDGVRALTRSPSLTERC